MMEQAWQLGINTWLGRDTDKTGGAPLLLIGWRKAGVDSVGHGDNSETDGIWMADFVMTNHLNPLDATTTIQ